VIEPLAASSSPAATVSDPIRSSWRISSRSAESVTSVRTSVVAEKLPMPLRRTYPE
jgi:hypothetical protein